MKVWWYRDLDVTDESSGWSLQFRGAYSYDAEHEYDDGENDERDEHYYLWINNPGKNKLKYLSNFSIKEKDARFRVVAEEISEDGEPTNRKVLKSRREENGRKQVVKYKSDCSEESTVRFNIEFF